MERKISRYFQMSPEKREILKAHQRQKYRNDPTLQRKRMYLRACSKGLIRCPRKLDHYLGTMEINNILVDANGPEGKEA